MLFFNIFFIIILGSPWGYGSMVPQWAHCNSPGGFIVVHVMSPIIHTVHSTPMSLALSSKTDTLLRRAWRGAAQCYAMLRNAAQCYAMLRNAAQCCAVLRNAAFRLVRKLMNNITYNIIYDMRYNIR